MSGEGSRAQAVRKRIEGASPVDQHRVLGGENSGRAPRGDRSAEGRRQGAQAARGDHQAWKIEDLSKGESGEDVHGRSGRFGYALGGWYCRSVAAQIRAGSNIHLYRRHTRRRQPLHQFGTVHRHREYDRTFTSSF